MITALLLAVAAAVPPAATVNGVPLAAWEAEREFSSKVGATRFHRSMDADTRSTLRRQALDGLVLKELKRQWAAANDVTPDADEVERAWSKVRERFPDEGAYRKALDALGIDHAAFRAAFVRDAAAAAVDRSVQDRVEAPTDAEQRAFFDAHRQDYTAPRARHLVHLLLYVPPGSDDAVAKRTERRASAIAARVRSGEVDLAAEAERRRDTLPPKYRDQVGDLGFIHEGALVAELEAAVQAAGPGEVVGPIRTLFGFHVARIVEVRPASPMPFPQVQAAVAARMLRERRAAALATFEATLRASASVDETAWPDAP